MSARWFRKRPVVIEAFEFDGSQESARNLQRWMVEGVLVITGLGDGLWKVEIPTLEGTMTASPGDFVIRGVQGEFYPCKPDIFAATYEEVRS